MLAFFATLTVVEIILIAVTATAAVIVLTNDHEANAEALAALIRWVKSIELPRPYVAPIPGIKAKPGEITFPVPLFPFPPLLIPMMSKPLTITGSRTISKTRTRTETAKINVYNIIVNVTGAYRDYVRGKPYDPEYIIMQEGKVYKYGTTKYKNLLKRYKSNKYWEKDGYIKLKIQSGEFIGIQGTPPFIVYDLPVIVGLLTEKAFIFRYVIGNFKMPPGNTKFG